MTRGRRGPRHGSGGLRICKKTPVVLRADGEGTGLCVKRDGRPERWRWVVQFCLNGEGDRTHTRIEQEGFETGHRSLGCLTSGKEGEERYRLRLDVGGRTTAPRDERGIGCEDSIQGGGRGVPREKNERSKVIRNVYRRKLV